MARECSRSLPANRLDVVAVGIENERAVVVWMILRAQTGRAVVAAAGGNSGVIKRIDEGAARNPKRDMNRNRSGLAAGQPELRTQSLRESFLGAITRNIGVAGYRGGNSFRTAMPMAPSAAE